MDLKKNITECAFHITPNSNGHCLEDEIIKELKVYAKNIKKLDTSGDVIIKLKKEHGCETESCLLETSEIKKFLGSDKITKQLNKRFKPEGPYDSFDWFSNTHIDSVLEQIEIKYKHKSFLHIDFQMRDFEKVGTALAKTDLVTEYNKGIRCFGVVFNTDWSSGGGQHWFSIFGDFSKPPFTIEYFNSSGDAPQPEITSWMNRTAKHMNKMLNIEVNTEQVTTIVNQHDNHSCGSYSLYYIICRLEGIPFLYFRNNKIGDSEMHRFRKTYLFRRPKKNNNS